MQLHVLDALCSITVPGTDHAPARNYIDSKGHFASPDQILLWGCEGGAVKTSHM